MHMRRWAAWCGLVMVACSLTLGGSGCATTAGEPLSPDAALSQSVMDRLGQEMLLERASVLATSAEGVVTLTGVVRTDAQRARAVAIARSTAGVLDVVDRLRRY